MKLISGLIQVREISGKKKRNGHWSVMVKSGKFALGQGKVTK